MGVFYRYLLFKKIIIYFFDNSLKHLMIFY